ncbi:hypothetical protein PSECIP111951_02408 [Pseudoalteromonas holothuriae]|uniref:Cell wall-binding protein n=1 Tax=Pseudoalteromonas holothuriae TaxID=2963714 RepID=A0A9W4QUF9_9GAMM|nr:MULTISPECIES: InlB B-repeat-containing protein [unclassified Pseudoalteromonas]CAH9053772.1 hypothetical protein PSECIP111854_01236 [Pseudoalteromonas sp. CIP111854]CAH9061061.1 hypothetical protein PSECIP111951_02408 [Pseudoalteromonas sp. CIP111951]
MKNFCKWFCLVMQCTITLFVLPVHATNTDNNLCQLNDRQLHERLDLVAHYGQAHLNDALNYFKSQCYLAKPKFSRQLLADSIEQPQLKITDFKLSHSSLNLDSGNKNITVTLKAYDENGIKTATVLILPPDNSDSLQKKRVTLDDWQSTAEDNVYQASASISFETQTDVSGQWRAGVWWIRSINDKMRSANHQQLKAMGFNPYLIIVNSTQIDVKAPKIKAFSLSKQEVNVDQGQQTINATIQLFDDTGVHSVFMSLEPPKEYSYTLSKIHTVTEFKETQEQGIVEANVSFTLDNTDVAGVWRARVSVYDDLNNYERISSQKIVDAGFDPHITILNTSTVDTTPPKLKSLVLSTNEVALLAGQQTLTATATFFDPSGMGAGYISLVSPDGGKDKIENIESWQKTTEKDVYSTTIEFTLSQEDKAGVWYVRSWWVLDGNDNRFDRTKPNDIVALGANPYVFFNVEQSDIKDLNIDTTAKSFEGTINDSIEIKLSLKELVGQALPEAFSIDVISDDNTSVLFSSVSGNSTTQCTLVNGNGTCNILVPAETLDADVAFNITPRTLSSASVQFRLVSDVPELIFNNNVADVTVTGIEPITYTVQFLDWDGTVLSTQEVAAGKNAIPPEQAMIREGHTFKGWDRAMSKIVTDTVITAQYEVNKYTVTYLDWNGSTLFSEQVAYGTDAKGPTNNPDREGYTFIGWSGQSKEIKSESVLTAQYEINTYTVTFKDWDGTILSDVIVNYGAAVPALATHPVREGYTFIGWDVALTNITGNTVATAQYSINEYIVVFKDWDGTILSDVIVNYGSAVPAPLIHPVREGYTFVGWDVALTNITGNTVATAQYSINEYIVVFKDWDGKELENQRVSHGLAAVPPVNPSREGYTFSQWSQPFDEVTTALIITAQYTKLAEVVLKPNSGGEKPSSSGTFGFGVYMMSLLMLALVRRINSNN